MAERLGMDRDQLAPFGEGIATPSMDFECALDDECTVALEAEIERSGVFERVRKRALTRRLQHIRERSQAQGLYAELMDSSERQRGERLRREDAFHTRALVDLMLSESREAWYRDIHQADTISSLALGLLSRLDPERYGAENLADLGAKAWAYYGNVHRLHYRWVEASAAFQAAEEKLQQGTGDPLLRALFCDLKATLHGDRRELDARLSLLEEATAIYAELGETHLVGRTLVGHAVTLKQMERVEEAVSLLYRALTQLDPQQEPQLQLIVRHNLMFDLCEIGRATEAAKLLEDFRPRYLENPAPATQLRLRWLEGKIALGTGNLEAAEVDFRATQKGFEDHGENYAAASAALDLAAVYAMQRRTADLKRLATELFTTFQSHDIHREAYAAIILFQQAAELEQVNLQVVKRVATLVERSQHLPPDQPS